MNSKPKDSGLLTITGADSIEKIDSQIKDSFSKLEITGLKQQGFDYLVERYGAQFIHISFFKCPLISDLTKLETLTNIESLAFYWNQRSDSLWDLSKNSELKSISLDDFTRLHALDELSLSGSLEEIRFGNRIWDTLVIESLSPLAGVKHLKRLSFSAKKVENNRVSPLSMIESLEKIEFPSNLFSTEKVAWLTAQIGSRVSSEVLAPLFKTDHPISSGNKNIDTFIVGKRKPSLDSVKDAKRIQKYIDKFNALVDHYRMNPEEGEPD